MEKVEDNDFNLVDEFCLETKIRLLADKMRVHGISARLADDCFHEYIGLDRKLNYIHERISNAEHVLGNLKKYRESNELSPELIDAYREYILNGSQFEKDKKGLVANFYHESKFKSTNDELMEALQEFKIAVKGGSANQQRVKTEMAKILFAQGGQTAEVLNPMANRFVENGTCDNLIQQLAVRSACGEAKWKQAGALVIRAGFITPYCNTKLDIHDYQFTAEAGLNAIQDFVKADMQKFAQPKKRKFIADNVVVKAINNLLQRIS